MVCESITTVCEEIKQNLSSGEGKKGVALLYAFNATGKTRLSGELRKLNENDEGSLKVLSYDAFLEDLFTWDNEQYALKFDTGSWVARLVIEQGIENDITKNFRFITNSNIEPIFDFDEGVVTFALASGDDDSEERIKISRGEESVFVWSIFFSILETAIDSLNTEIDNRTTDIFNDLEYVVIDDPVSSIDDARIVTVAVGLLQTISESNNPNLHFLISTHHALFYNVLFNSFQRLKRGEVKKLYYLLSKNIDSTLTLGQQESDSPFAYHLLVIDRLNEVIQSRDIEKYHFNLFRGLLEKTANFLGYKSWSDCVIVQNKEAFVRTVHLYSHSKLVDLEGSRVSDVDKQLFIDAFGAFIERFNFGSEYHVRQQ